MSERSADPPLVVDLDGTLIKTDLLLESANSFLTSPHGGVFRLARLVLGGRARLKTALANAVDLDIPNLPFNTEVVALVQSSRERGTKTVLATATATRYADAVAAHLGVFDEVFATDSTTNLKSTRKARLLVEHYGKGGFDYVGNDNADLAVWAEARSAIVASSSRRLAKRVRGLGIPITTVATGRGSVIRAALRELRPHQWVKNVLVFVPLVAAHSLNSASILLALAAFLAFNLTASSVYVLNDLVDLGDDRHHAGKRSRPIAAGTLSIAVAWPLVVVLLGAGIVLALLLLPLQFVGVLGAYVVLTLLYSFGLKRRAIVDVLALAGLYTLRIVAGSAAISVEPTFWLLTFSTFFFLSLALIKRFSELKSARSIGAAGPIKGRGYSHDDLELVSALGVSTGLMAVLIFALYIQDPHTAELYRNPQILWLVGPILLFWISRSWLITHRGEMHDDPIVFALKDRTSWIAGAFAVAVFVLAALLR